MLTKEQETYFEKVCLQFRRDLIEVLHEKKTGHPGGSLSVCEILATLLLERMKNVDVNDPQKPDRDRLVLCKGHAAPMLYRVLAEKGFFPVEEMHTLRDLNTRLQGHPQMLDTPGVDLTSGPLGIGLGAALGMALSLSSSPWPRPSSRRTTCAPSWTGTAYSWTAPPTRSCPPATCMRSSKPSAGT